MDQLQGDFMKQAAVVQEEARVATQPRDGDSGSTSPLQSTEVLPMPFRYAKTLLVREHYLHSLPAGTLLTFGVFLGRRLLGAVTFEQDCIEFLQCLRSGR